MRDWIHSWAVWSHIFLSVMRKRHGRGGDFIRALRSARCARWIVWGQHRGHRLWLINARPRARSNG